MHKKVLDCLVLFALAVFAILFSLLIHAIFLVSAFLFLGLPSIYLISRGKVKVKLTTVTVLLFGFLYCFLMDYLAELYGAWSWKPSQLIFQSKILGVVSPDAIIWTALWVLLLVLFYEHMLEHHRKDKISSRIWYLVGIGLAFLSVIVWFSTTNPAQSHSSYAYFILGLCTIPPFLFVLYSKPRLVLKVLKTMLYFVPLYLSYEITGRYLGQWDFPGHYIGMIQIGSVWFPLEEFMFWIVGSSVLTLTGYELFIDEKGYK